MIFEHQVKSTNNEEVGWPRLSEHTSTGPCTLAKLFVAGTGLACVLLLCTLTTIVSSCSTVVDKVESVDIFPGDRCVGSGPMRCVAASSCSQVAKYQAADSPKQHGSFSLSESKACVPSSRYGELC